MNKVVTDLVQALDGLVQFIHDHGIHDRNGLSLDISEYIKTAEQALKAAKMKKNPWDKNQFKKSNVKGSSESWKNAAKGAQTSILSVDDDMTTLNIKELTDLKSLTKARNQAMHQAHPDKGGTDEQARTINDAYNRLKLRLP